MGYRDGMCTRHRLLPLLAPGVVLAGLGLVGVVVGERLPDRIPTHWNVHGEPDGWSSPAMFTIVILLIGLVVWGVTAGVALAGRRAVVGARLLVGLPLGIVSFVAGVGAVVLVSATGGGAPLPWLLLLSLVVGGLGWATGVALAGRLPETSPRPVRNLGTRWDGETPTSWFVTILGGTLIVVGLVASLTIPMPAGPLSFLVGLLMVGSARFRVVIDDKAVRIEGGLAGFPRVVVPLERVAAAEVAEVNPWRFGGLGIRIGLGGESAVITRRGPALKIITTDGAELLVSLVDPSAAVATISERLVDAEG